MTFIITMGWNIKCAFLEIELHCWICNNGFLTYSIYCIICINYFSHIQMSYWRSGHKLKYDSYQLHFSILWYILQGQWLMFISSLRFSWGGRGLLMSICDYIDGRWSVKMERPVGVSQPKENQYYFPWDPLSLSICEVYIPISDADSAMCA